jgi:hypothetical protein
LLNADVYTGTFNGNPIWLAIDPSGQTTVYIGSLSNAAFTGTYNPSSQVFDFGNANIGTLTVLDYSNNILATSSGNGNLGIPGNLLSFSSTTWEISLK